MSFKPIDDEDVIGTEKPVPGGLLQDLMLDLKSLNDYPGGVTATPQYRRECSSVGWSGGQISYTGSTPYSFSNTITGYLTGLTSAGYDVSTIGLEMSSTLEQPQVIPVPYTWGRRKRTVSVVFTCSIDGPVTFGNGRVLITAGYALADGTVRPPISMDEFISTAPSDRPFALATGAESSTTVKIFEAVISGGFKMFRVDVTRNDESEENSGWILLAIRTQWRATTSGTIDQADVNFVYSSPDNIGTIDPNYLTLNENSSVRYNTLFGSIRTGPKAFYGIAFSRTEEGVTRRSYHTLLRVTPNGGEVPGSRSLMWFSPALPQWLLAGVSNDPGFEFNLDFHENPIVRIFSITVEDTSNINTDEFKRSLAPGAPALSSAFNTLADPRLGYFDGPQATMFPIRVKGPDNEGSLQGFTVLEKNDAIFWWSYNNSDYEAVGPLGAGFYQFRGWNGMDVKYQMFSTTPSQDAVGNAAVSERYYDAYLIVDGDDASSVQVGYPFAITQQSPFDGLYQQLPPDPAFLDGYPSILLTPPETYLYTGGLHPAALADRTLNLGGIDTQAFPAPRLYPLPGTDIPGGLATTLAGTLPLESIDAVFSPIAGSRSFLNSYAGDAAKPMTSSLIEFEVNEQLEAAPTDNLIVWYLPTATSRFTRTP